MKKLNPNPTLPRTALLCGAALLASQAAWSAPGGNGNGGGNGTAAQLAAIEADIAALQSEVAILSESIALLGVNTVDADCTTDSGALQAAIDAAPPAGAIITVTGTCDSADITGKANLLLDGGALGAGNGVTGDLVVSASNNIQLSGINAGTMTISDNASVFTGDLAVAADVVVEVNGSLTQESGTINFGGSVLASTGARVDLNNGSITGIQQSRNTSVILNAFRDETTVVAITVTGTVGVFSGSHFLAQANSTTGTVTIDGDLFAQRNAAILLAGEGLAINAASATVRQNSVLDVIGIPEAGFNVTNVNLTTGGGSRLFFSDSANTYVANCDASAWVDIFMTCAP